MPVTTVEKVTALSRDLARSGVWLSCSMSARRKITRWRRGQGNDDVNAGRVDLLELVMAHLLGLYPTETAERWLVGANPSLRERRPVDLIRHGQAHEVLDAIASGPAASREAVAGPAVGPVGSSHSPSWRSTPHAVLVDLDDPAVLAAETLRPSIVSMTRP